MNSGEELNELVGGRRRLEEQSGDYESTYGSGGVSLATKETIKEKDSKEPLSIFGQPSISVQNGTLSWFQIQDLCWDNLMDPIVNRDELDTIMKKAEDLAASDSAEDLQPPSPKRALLEDTRRPVAAPPVPAPAPQKVRSRYRGHPRYASSHRSRGGRVHARIHPDDEHEWHRLRHAIEHANHSLYADAGAGPLPAEDGGDGLGDEVWSGMAHVAGLAAGLAGGLDAMHGDHQFDEQWVHEANHTLRTQLRSFEQHGADRLAALDRSERRLLNPRQQLNGRLLEKLLPDLDRGIPYGELEKGLKKIWQFKPVEILQNTVSNKSSARFIAQLWPGSSFLRSALQFYDRWIHKIDGAGAALPWPIDFMATPGRKYTCDDGKTDCKSHADCKKCCPASQDSAAEHFFRSNALSCIATARILIPAQCSAIS